MKGGFDSDIDAIEVDLDDSSEDAGEEDPFDRLSECSGWTLPAEVVAHGTLEEGNADYSPCFHELPPVLAVGMDGEFWVMTDAIWVVSTDGATRREWVQPDTCTDWLWDLRPETERVMLLRGNCASLLDSSGIESEPAVIFDDSAWPGDQAIPQFVAGAVDPMAIARSEPGLGDWGLRIVPLEPDGTRIEAGPYVEMSDTGWNVEAYDHRLHAGMIGDAIHVTFRGGSDEPRHLGLVHTVLSAEGAILAGPFPVPETDRVSADIWSSAHTTRGTVVGWWSTSGPLSEYLRLTWIPLEAMDEGDLVTGPGYYEPGFFHAVETRNHDSFVSVVSAALFTDLCTDFRVSHGWDPALPDWGPPSDIDIAGGVGIPCLDTGALARSDNQYIFIWWESYEVGEDSHDYALQYVIFELP